MRKDELHSKDCSLIAGPYTAPLCDVGDWLDDAYYGRVEVAGFTEAPLSWPRRRGKGPPAPILTPELVRAIETESAFAVAYWWGMSYTQIQNWRRWLGVGRATPGSSRLLTVNVGKVRPESREKAATLRRGQPAHPNSREALLRGAKQPKSPEWKQKATVWLKNSARRAHREGK